jgi:hypothetical protein
MRFLFRRKLLPSWYSGPSWVEGVPVLGAIPDVGLGATHYRWRADVARIVERIEANFPNVRCNTYVDHPWPGWDGRSVDCWGRGGRGDAIPSHTGAAVLEYVFNLRTGPYLRHYIYRHTLWTSFGGKSLWVPNDHSRGLRHVHFTYW